MRVEIKQIILLIVMFYIPFQDLFSQHTSKDNYTGTWGTPTTWNPPWTVPQTSISGFDITINGYITLSGSLTFFSSTTNLIVNDTLVIIGNLTLGNKNNVTVNDNGILIIRGDLTIDNQTIIKADGYLVVTNNVIKNSSINQGSFTSNDNPVKVFIGGIISKVGITNNNLFYPVLNTIAPSTTPYLNSSYGYGNMIDLANDPLYPFFQTTCTLATPTITADGPTSLCAGGSVTLTSSAGTTYLWSTGATSSSIIVNMAGSYSVKVTNASECQSAVSTAVIVGINALPLVNITSSSSPLCVNDQQTLTGNPAGGTFIVTGGPGNIFGNVLSVTGIGIINLEYNYTNICFNTAKQSIIVNEKPVAVAGSDQELKFIFETQMEAELSSSETGDWSVISGSGQILDINSPTSGIIELPVGENIFLWTVRNGKCESSDEVKITIYDLFVPSVITPNGDGKNDYFQISALVGRVELIIFNKWGNLEYENSNYLNNWDGRNNKGAELPDDTYFYIFKLGNGIIRKGTVLITR